MPLSNAQYMYMRYTHLNASPIVRFTLIEFSVIGIWKETCYDSEAATSVL